MYQIHHDRPGEDFRAAQPCVRRDLNLLMAGDADGAHGHRIARQLSGKRLRVLAWTSSLLEAIALCEAQTVDLVVLDAACPSSEASLFGMEARRHGYRGLILHAIDVPPHEPARVHYALPPMSVGDFVLEPANRRVLVGGNEIRCKDREFELLQLFCNCPGRVIPYRELLEAIWGDAQRPVHTLREWIRSLRARLQPLGKSRYIVTHRGIGYRFIPAPQLPPDSDALSTEDSKT